MLSPPCSRFSQIHRYFKKNKKAASSRQKDAEALELLQFAMDVAKSQFRNRRKFIFEHPASASSWQLDIVKSVKDIPGIYTVDFDQCALGLCTRVQQIPTKKRTRFLTNLPGVVHTFREFQCRCKPVHLVKGKNKKLHPHPKGLSRAAVYPPAMCYAMAKCIADHCKFKMSSLLLLSFGIECCMQ